jgi:hypothetical protein
VWELKMVRWASRETALTTACCVRLSVSKSWSAVLANTVAFTSTDSNAGLWLSPVTVTLSPFGFLYGGGDGGTRMGGNTVGAGVGDSPGHGGDAEGAGVGAVGAAESAAGIEVGAVGAAESAAGTGVGAVRMSFPNPETSTLAS